jgi:hypothetical protein
MLFRVPLTSGLYLRGPARTASNEKKFLFIEIRLIRGENFHLKQSIIQHLTFDVVYRFLIY